MLCHFKPKRLIEIGSGFSSAAMLDTNDNNLQSNIFFTFIEPNPDRLFNLLTEEDKKQHRIIQRNVQEVDFEVFSDLEEDDILFIDSSHVVKVGSDVVCLLFQIIPRLKPGVIIHFHDIFYPFEYPSQWFEEGRAWNEIYCLRAFLQYNSAFEILYFNSFIELVHQDLLKLKMPLCLKNPGSSLWLRKI